ncbi:MAG: sugar transferase [Actinomycetota bacterium]
MKRTVDLVASVVLLLILTPVIALAALVMMIVLRGAPGFSQIRIGRCGNPFKVWKIRTLALDTDRSLDSTEVNLLRIHPLARLLRISHIDELPQLVQVLTGRMSLVGPRPHIPRLRDQIPAMYRLERERLRPGMTGVWQLSRFRPDDVIDGAVCDRAYFLVQSFTLDIRLLILTLVTGFGIRQLNVETILGRRRLSSPCLDSIRSQLCAKD